MPRKNFEDDLQTTDDNPGGSNRSVNTDNSNGRGRSRDKGLDSSKGSKGGDDFNVVINTPRGDGSFDALATPARDRLTGQPGDVGTFFTWTNLTDSLLKGSRRSVLIDEVRDFTSLVDGLDAPLNVTTQEILNPGGRINKLNAGQINAKGVGGESFAANTAAAFTCKGYSGVFVVFNDARAGYQQNSDSLIQLVGYTFAPIGIY